MNKDALLRVYRRAYLIRRTELEIINRYYPNPDDLTESPMACPVHLHMGSEVLAALVAEQFPSNTHVYGTHRSHAPYLAFGGDLKKMIAELYGKKTGAAGGWGGSMHLVDRDAGFMGASAIVGSIQSVAIGDAYAAKLDQDDRVVLVWMGEAALESGQFWEANNFAALHGLRIRWIVEDNNFATATPRSLRQSSRIGNQLASDIDVTVFSDLARRVGMIDPKAKKGVTNRFAVERMKEHVGVNDDAWRDEAEDVAFKTLAAQAHTTAPYEVGRIRSAVNKAVAEAFDAAESADWPERSWA